MTNKQRETVILNIHSIVLELEDTDDLDIEMAEHKLHEAISWIRRGM